jgi:LysR family transcriptional regulator, regulator for metE and metH
MDLDTRTLELLEAIASDGTLTAAAQRLHVSQPALSQRLSGLEARLGLPLFERQGRRLVPTRAGRRMTLAAGTALRELRAAARDLDDLRHERDGSLRFVSQCSTNYQWLPPVVHTFADRCPGVEVRIESVADDDPIAALIDDRVDVALVIKSDRRSEALRTRPLFDDEVVAVVPDDHPWAGRPHVDAADFDGIDLVLFDSYDPARTPRLPLPIPAASRPGRVITTPPVGELIIEMVCAGQGVAVLPGWVAAPYRESRRVTTVRITATPEVRTWSCVTRQGDRPHHVDAFVELLADLFAGGAAPVAAGDIAAA